MSTLALLFLVLGLGLIAWVSARVRSTRFLAAGHKPHSLPGYHGWLVFIFATVRSGEPLYIERAYAAAAILLLLVLVLFITARLLARPRKGSR